MGDTATAGPHGPRDGGEEGQLALWKEGQGLAVPKVPSFQHMGLEMPPRPGHRAQPEGPAPFLTIARVPVGRGGA